MNSVLRAELYKAIKSKSFFICLAFLILIIPLSIHIIIESPDEFSRGVSGASIILDRMGDNIPVVTIAVFIAEFIGMEFQTARIKLIIPHMNSRAYFYISKLIVCCIGMLAANAISLVFYGIVATVKWGFDPTQIFNFSGFFAFCFLQMFALCAYTAIFVCCSFFTESFGIAFAVDVLIVMFVPQILQFLDRILGTQSFFYNSWPGICALRAATYEPTLSIICEVVFSCIVIIGSSTMLGCWRLNHREI
ncbi:MAG: hypothetical protein PHG16_05330 [Lachnospiraceae bacterium]|nr:hypothetical protein [Lachnospiraceae bacterium]